MDREVGGLSDAETLANLRSRKDFLKMAGAAGLGAAVGSNILLRNAMGRPAAVVDDPRDLRFEKASEYRPFDVISDNFVQYSNRFGKNAELPEVFSPEDQQGSVSINNGRLRVSGSEFFTLFRTSESPLAPYAAVIVNVAAFSRSATGENTVYAGLIKADQSYGDNYVVAWYNHATKKVGIDAVVEGTVHRLTEEDVALETPVRFAFVLNSKEVTALADYGGGPFGGWKPIANYPNEPTEEFPDPSIAPGLTEFIDLRDPEVLDDYRYGFGVRADSGTIALESVEAGYWGRAGVRDPHVVTWADGTPYIVDNKLYLTLTNAGLDFFATGHWGVYTIDLSNYTSPRALEEVGKIFFKREENDPAKEVKEVKVFGDHAGHIIYDDTTGEFLVGASTWGDFTYQGVQINYTRTSEDILHDVHVLEVQKLELPVTPNITYINRGNWDPHFVRIGGEWYVAFVDSPSQGNPWKHYPALAKGPDLETLTLVGAESHLNETEGVVIQRFGGKWYLLCTSGDNERGGLEEGDLEAGAGTFRIYLLERDEEGHGLKFFGTLNADHPTNIPHPMVTPLPRDGNTKWVMFTFEGTMYYEEILGYGTHGNFIVMNGRPKQEGYEFPPREP